MSDIDVGEPESLQQLAGLQLVPTMSASLTSLQKSGTQRTRPLFLATRQQQGLLDGSRDALVSCKVSSALQSIALPRSTKSYASIEAWHSYQRLRRACPTERCLMALLSFQAWY